MQKKLLLTYISIIALSMVFSVFLSWRSINIYFESRVESETAQETALIERLLEDVDTSPEVLQAYVDELSGITDLRLTIIAKDGTVIADSDNVASEMNNHANRPEIIGASEGEPSSNVRYSTTMRMFFYYYAIPFQVEGFDGYLRSSVPAEEIESITTNLIKIVIIGVAIGALVAIGVATLMTRRFMEPINELTRVAKIIAEGNYDEKIYLSSDDQVGELAEAFNTMTYVLRKNIWELSYRNAELESILTSMNSGLAAIDNDFVITLNNDTFPRMLDLDDRAIDGKKFYEVVRELTVFEIVEKSIKDQDYLSKEMVLDIDGEEKIIQITATPIYDKHTVHKQLGALIILMDVTQIRKLEGMRRDFVSNVTHELKTPLTSIRGFVDTLKNGAMDDKAVAMRFLDIIDIETDRLSNLIQDILSLSEIETVVGEKNIGDYSFDEIMGEVIDILPRHHEGVELITEIDDRLPLFTCNKNRMKQLMINIIDNSLKYTVEGYVKISAFERHGYLNITVEDTGIGIERMHLSRLFERFYRVDKGRSRKMGGTGLGLSIVKHIVELYSGDIAIDSEVGQGTVITIKLPY